MNRSIFQQYYQQLTKNKYFIQRKNKIINKNTLNSKLKNLQNKKNFFKKFQIFFLMFFRSEFIPQIKAKFVNFLCVPDYSKKINIIKHIAILKKIQKVFKTSLNLRKQIFIVYRLKFLKRQLFFQNKKYKLNLIVIIKSFIKQYYKNIFIEWNKNYLKKNDLKNKNFFLIMWGYFSYNIYNFFKYKFFFYLINLVYSTCIFIFFYIIFALIYQNLIFMYISYCDSFITVYL